VLRLFRTFYRRQRINVSRAASVGFEREDAEFSGRSCHCIMPLMTQMHMSSAVSPQLILLSFIDLHFFHDWVQFFSRNVHYNQILNQ